MVLRRIGGNESMDRPKLAGPTLTFVTLLALIVGCQSPSYTRRGAALGGLTGAGVGAAIGHASGQTGPGALIGTAVGVLSGSAIGSGLDSVRAENRAMIDERFAQQQAGATSTHELIEMTRAGLSDDVIIRHIQVHGLRQPLSTADLITLKQCGVRDEVLRAVQDQANQPARQVAQASYAEPVLDDGPDVVVEEHYYPVPAYCPPHVPRPWCGPPPMRHHHARPGISWGFSMHD